MTRIIKNFLFGNNLLRNHILLVTVLLIIIIIFIYLSDINIIECYSLIICYDTVLLSATLIGFEFTGLSIMMLYKHPRLEILKGIGDYTPYKIILYSIFLLLMSIPFMIISIIALDHLNGDLNYISHMLIFISIFLLVLGYILFISEILLMIALFKNEIDDR